MNTLFALTGTENLKAYKGESETNEDQRNVEVEILVTYYVVSKYGFPVIGGNVTYIGSE